MKTAAEEAAWLIEEFIAFKSHDQKDDQKRLRNILKLFETDIRKELNEFISDIAKLLGEDDLGHDGKSWSIDDFKDAIDRSRAGITEGKTQPCPACGKPLITSKEYFPALTKMNEEISKYREVLIKDYEVDKKIEAGVCPQCDKEVGEKELTKNGSVCAPCREQNSIDNQRISELVIDGHTAHCAKRIVWGDGECECGESIEP